MTTLTINQPIALMNIKEISSEEVMNHSMKAYNESIWKRNIKDYLAKTINPKFYERTDLTEYPELFVEYTINEGIRFFARLGYSAMLSNAGFLSVNIHNNQITTEYPIMCDSEYHAIANNKDGRKYMVEMSSKFGYVFSNCLPASKTQPMTIELV